MTSEASSNLGGRSEKMIERQRPTEGSVRSDRAHFELTPLPIPIPPAPSPPNPTSPPSPEPSTPPCPASPPPSPPPASYDLPPWVAPEPRRPSHRQETTRPQRRPPRQRPEEPQRRERQYCRFFVLGGHCRYGDACAYSHELPPGGIAEARRLTPCPYYRRGGGCRYGDFCQLLHEDPPTTATGGDGGGGGNDDPTRSSTADSSRREVGDGGEGDAADDGDHPTCGICFEDVSGSPDRRYGLLSGCSHAFCLDCLRKWRRVGAGDPEARRSCPACRAVSDLVVPSRRYVPEGTEKDEIVDGYKSRLSVIPCRNFDSTGGGRLGSCPFGRECLYAHLDEDGRDVKSRDHRRRRRRRRRNNGGGGIQGDLDMIVTFFNLLDMYGLEFFGESGDEDDDDDDNDDEDNDWSRSVD